MNKTESFSYKEHDKTSASAVKRLKAYAKSTGTSFSFLIIKAIKLLLEEMDNDSKSE